MFTQVTSNNKQKLGQLITLTVATPQTPDASLYVYASVCDFTAKAF